MRILVNKLGLVVFKGHPNQCPDIEYDIDQLLEDKPIVSQSDEDALQEKEMKSDIWAPFANKFNYNNFDHAELKELSQFKNIDHEMVKLEIKDFAIMCQEIQN